MKICFKCKKELPISEFYSHPMMADGHLNKCKNCTRSDTRSRELQKLKDPKWVELELERHRKKAAKYRASGTAWVPTKKQKKAISLRYKEKYPQKNYARIALNNAVRDGKVIKQPCEICGSTDSEGHHDDYMRPLNVRWLCPKHHAERHVELRRIARALKLSSTSSNRAPAGPLWGSRIPCEV
jgi:hypothetical protein